MRVDCGIERANRVQWSLETASCGVGKIRVGWYMLEEAHECTKRRCTYQWSFLRGPCAECFGGRKCHELQAPGSQLLACVRGDIFEAWHYGGCELTGLLLVEGHVRVGLALQRGLRAMVRFD